MKYSNSIEYNISTKLDKSGITQLQAQIKQLENSMQQMSNRELIDSEKVQSARAQLQGLNTALTNSFNPSLGILDFTKFRAELDKNNVSALQLKSVFNTMGVEGQKVLKGLTTQIADFNGGMERTSSTIDKMFVTFSNTFRWGLISSFFSQFMNAIHSSVQYAKDLDDSLTQIMLVTDYSRDSMNEYARAANEAAKAVGQTTVGMTNASLIFAQQGYDLNQSQQLATLSAKLANASQQDTAATSDQITAYMNAYGLQDSMDELVQAMDNWAKIANISAADVEEIALASQRAASMANAVGVSGEALAAQIATIESVTREAPEQIGNGLKTLYARFSDLKLGKDDEDGIGLGKVTSTLQQIGVQVLDAFGNVRDMDDIMEDLMIVWEDLDDTSKTAAAQALAGKHQVNRFMALMENADMYQEYKGATGVSASGTLEQMNAEYLDSLQGRMTKLQASLEGLFSSIFNTDDIYPWIDKAQDAVDLLQKFFDALGGGKTILLGMATLFGKLFNQNIAHSINSMMENAALGQTRKNNVESINQTLDRAGIDSSQGVGAYIRETAEQTKLGALSNDQYRTYLDNVQNWTNNSIALAEAEQQLTDTINIANAVFKKVAGDAPFKQKTDEAGTTTVTGGFDAREVDVKERKEAIQNIDFTEEIQQTKKVTLELNNLHDSMESLGKDGTTSVQDIKKKIAELIQSLNGLDNVYDLDKVEDLGNALFDLENELNETGNASDESKKKVADYGREIGELNKRLHEMDSSAAERVINDSGREAEQQAIELNFRRVAEQNAKQKAMDDQASINRQQAVKSILDVVNAVQQLTFSYQAFKNIGSIWANEDLTKGEKVLQTIMNLTMALPQLINAMKVLQSTDLMGNIAQVSKFAKTLQELGIPGSKKFVDSLKNIGSESEDTKKLLAGLSPAIGEAMATAAAEGASGLGVLSAGFKALAAEMAPVLADLLPFIAAAAAIGALIAIVQYGMEQIEKTKQEALDALHEAQDALNQAKAISDQVGSFRTTYNNNADGSKNSELIDQANDIASAMKEAGYESEAMAIHLATVRAEAAGTTEAFAELAATVDESRRQMEIQADVDAANASAEVLRTQNASLEEIISNESKLKDAQEQLNNLDPWDPAYETKKAELEEYIASLKEAATWSEEAADAAHTYMGAAGDVVGSSSWILGDNATLGQIEAFFTQQIPEFALLTEAQKLDYMLQYITDDAHRATVSVEQLLDANSSLSDNTDFQGYSSKDYIYQAFNDMGLNSEQQVKVLATLDMDASEQEIRGRLAEISQKMSEEGMTFDMALKSTMEPEDARAMTQQEFSSMQATDSDVNQEEFQELGNYLAQTAEAAEDLPDYLAYDAEALADFTEAILRYDDAVETAIDNMDDWEDTLKNARGNSQKMAKATSELAETYADLLDLDPDSVLSADFSGSIDNLEDLQLAIEGDEDAYRRLQEAAMEDITPNINFDTLNPDQLAQVSDALNTLGIDANNTVDAMAQAAAGLDGLDWEVNPVLNDGPFIDGLNQLIASGVMTSEQVQAALAAMGYDVELEPVQSEVESPEVAYNWVSDITPNEWHGTLPVTPNGMSDMTLSTTGSTRPIEGSVPNITYSAQPVESTSINQAAATAMKVNTGGGQSGGGGTQIKSITKKASGGQKSGNASHGGGNRGGGGGGGCFVAGTLVSLQNQFKNIEDIQIGDIVLSYNEEIHQNEYSIVLQTMIHDVTEEIYDLYIEDEILTVTGIHRFYIRRKHDIEWVPASDLHIGDYVLFADGNWHPIFKIKIKVRSLLVYNFEVSHNHNYYVGRNQILAHNKGGGKGGGGSAKTIQPKEQRTHKKDYYEKVDSQLDKIKEQLSGIEKQEDKLIGDKARANQTKQLALLKREVDLQKEKLDILKTQEMPDVDKKLEEQYNSLKTLITNQGLNIELPALHLNEDDIYDNFEDISKAVDDVYNALIEKYNAAAAAGDEETTKAIDKLIKKMDEEGKGVLDNIQKHNDLQKTQVEWTNAIQDTIDAMQDLRIEAYKTSMEAIDDLKDLNKEWAEFEGFLTGLPTDSPFRSLTEDLSELNSSFEITKKEAKGFYNEIIKEKQKALVATSDAAEKQAIQLSIDYFKGLRDGLTDDMLENGLLGLAMEDLKELRKWYENPSLEGNPFGDNTAALKEAYEDALKRVIELTQDWQDLQEEIIDDIVDGYNEIADKQERQMSDYERLADRMEKFADLYALSYGEKSYKALSEIGNKQAETLRHQLSQQVNIYNYWADQYQKALDSGNEKLINEMKDKMDEAEDNMLDLAQDAAETFIDAYEKSIEAAIQKFNEKVIGDVDFDYLDLTWEWQDRLADGYLDDVESAFEIDKLRANYTDLLNDAQGASLATQNKIRQQMNEQLGILEDQETVSEYDVELANAKLNLLQKEIALEDAQRNKNQMQLRRDSQGNYRYVYRADQDEVNKAQREVFEAQQNIYKISKNHIEEVKKDIADIIKNYEEGIRKIANDPYLTEAEKEAKIKELTDYVNSIMPVLKEEFETAQNGIKTSLNESIDKAFTNSAAAAEEMLGKILDKEGKFKTDSGIIWWDSANELTQKVFPAISEAMGKLSATAKTEGEKLRENLTGNNGVLSMISEDLSTKDGYTTSIEDAAKKTIALDTATAGLNTQLQQETIDLQNVIKEVSDYNATLEKASQDLQALQKDYDNLKKTMADKLPNKIPGEIPTAEKKEDSKPTTTTTTTTNTNKDTKPTTTNTNRLNKDKVIGAYNEIMSGRAGNGDARWRYLSSKGYTDAEQNAAQKVVNAVFGGSSRDAALKKIVGYATGGYTGEWNNDGKLAVLHQKELVLNADDTRNILSAVDIVRQMTSTLGNALTNYSLGGTVGNLMSSALGNIEQRVEIKAEFPNVHDSFEIETALINLSDKAYQYAHRNI